MTEIVQFDIFRDSAIALAIGLLIGLERGWHSRERGEGARVAGIRTFALTALLGAVSALIAQVTAGWLVGAVLFVLGVTAVVGYWKRSEEDEDFGITTTIALILTFGLGALCVLDYAWLAVPVGVVVMLLLGFKNILHGWVKVLDEREMHATLKLALISAGVLPILPNQGFGPWEAINPYQLWWMVVLIAVISYVGYFSIKILGPRRGSFWTGALGGLVASTIAVLELSRLAGREKHPPPALATGSLAACGTMFVRVPVIAAVIYAPFAPHLAPPLLLMAVLTYAAAYILHKRGGSSTEGSAIELGNPFELKIVFGFALFLGAILIGSSALKAWYGEAGIYVLSALSGLADVDAMTLTLSQMLGNQELVRQVATVGLLLTTGVNTLVKIVMAFVLGGAAHGYRVALPLLLAFAAGVALWLFLISAVPAG